MGTFGHIKCLRVTIGDKRNEIRDYLGNDKGTMGGDGCFSADLCIATSFVSRLSNLSISFKLRPVKECP